MNSRLAWWRISLAALALGVTAGSAHALALHDLKGQSLENLYGTYAAGGDCQREPRITVDESGFAFRYERKDTRASTFVYAVSYYTGAHGTPSAEDADKTMFFPFPTGVKEGKWGPEVDAYGPLTMEFDSKQHTVVIEAGRDALLTPLQAALVRGSPYASCGRQAEMTALKSKQKTQAAANRARVERLSYPMHMSFIYNAIGPTAEMTAAVRRAAGTDLDRCPHADRRCYTITLADLDYDGRPDLLVQYGRATGLCGASGCGGIIVMAVPRGYAQQRLDNLQEFHNVVDILAGKHQGMHDLQYDGHGLVWIWNGRAYSTRNGVSANDPASEPATRRDTDAAGWQTREAANRMLAMVVATDSVIKTLSVFCNAGKPVLAMLVKARPPAGAVMLTFDFSGYPVVVPMGQGNREGTLWLSDLSRSDLPAWFTHRGSDAAKAEFARVATEASLAINGGTQGRISLTNSIAATRTALSGCYRY